jgi:hypothetical protein
VRDFDGAHQPLIVVSANGQKNGLYDKSGKYIKADVVAGEGEDGFRGVLVKVGEVDVDAVEVLPAHDGGPCDDQQVDHYYPLAVLPVMLAPSEPEGSYAADEEDCSRQDDQDDGIS